MRTNERRGRKRALGASYAAGAIACLAGMIVGFRVSYLVWERSFLLSFETFALSIGASYPLFACIGRSIAAFRGDSE